MFDFVDRNRKIVQIILGLVILTFMFWGIQSYRSGGANDAASVDGEKIGMSEFDLVLRQQQESLREQLGKRADQSMLDSPGFKLAVLERLIQRKLFTNDAQKVGIAVTDSQLISAIQGMPIFQKDGAFSDERYQTLLRGQGLTPVRFESEVRQDIAREQLLGAVAKDGFVAHASALQFVKMIDQKRLVSLASFMPEQYLKAQQVSEDEVRKYYKNHQDEFKVPEEVKVDYVVFSPETLQSKIAVSEEEAKQYYDTHKPEFTVPEERSASHILIPVAKDASKSQVEEAKARADKLVEELRKSPGNFAELAKKYSGDPGSASNGGNLGFFKQGMMVKPFDDAVFSMKQGEISDPVRSEFGFHIIKLDAIKPAGVRSFSEAKDDIVQEIRKQQAGKKFSDSADNFSNMVYEQSSSLKPAADAFGLQVQTSGWIDESGSSSSFPSDKKLLKAIFSDDSLKKKRNTEAVEVSPNVLVSAHVVDMKPAFTKPLSDVSDVIKKKLAEQKALDSAVQQGKSSLSQLQAGKEAAISWKPEVDVSRRDRKDLAPDVMKAVFGADVSKLPVYVG
ncbi:MAG TPA: SurA N-terminal domain-containing protein, partial [Burkholderiales bacterium]|nr:SurA N-terminal domain-containing protein [Burkholderiales bacterium]